MIMIVKRNKTGPIIVTICGSSRFIKYMFLAHHKLNSDGIMAFLPDLDPYADIPTESTPFNAEAQVMQDAKISLSDAILIINVDGYIGESTFHEFKLARKLGKVIEWFDRSEETMEKTRNRLIELEKIYGDV